MASRRTDNKKNHVDNSKNKPVDKNKKSYHVEFLNAAQKLAWVSFEQNEILFLIGPAGGGKTFLASAFALGEVINYKKKKIILTRPTVEAGESLGFLPGPQPLSSKIATPDGWTTMGKLKEGDLVISRNGTPSKVNQIFPKGKKMVYKITTSDGTHTECCLDHYWYTHTAEDKKRKRVGSVKSTQEILNTLKTKKGKVNHFLPRNEAVQFNKKDLPLSPYTLGVLLGDGNFGNSISFSSMDKELANKVALEVSSFGVTLTKHETPFTEACSYTLNSNVIRCKPARKVLVTNTINNSQQYFNNMDHAAKYLSLKKNQIEYRCSNKIQVENNLYEFVDLDNRWAHPVKKIISDLSLLNKKAWEKFIPDIYKYSSIQQRLDILRGLMDTDGTVKKTGEASFCTTSRQLALDVIEIVRSLGGRASLCERNRVGKKSILSNRIITTRRKSFEFTISLPNFMNPFFIKRKAEKFKTKYLHRVGITNIEPIDEKEVQCILVDNEEHLYLTDNFIVTHNTFEEKLNPYIMPIYDVINDMIGKDTPQREFIDRAIEIAPIAFLRGRSFKDAVCILDEAQNCTAMQLKLFLTRLGRNSKLIITGDPTQSDLPGPVALVDMIEKLKDIPGIGVIWFDKSSIVRHPLVGKILEKLGD